MALTSNEKKVLQDSLEALNGIISGPRLTIADIRVINDYGDVRFVDPARGAAIRDELFNRHIPGSERQAMEELAAIFDTLAPTPEAEERLRIQRLEMQVGIENVRRTTAGEPLLVLPSEGGDGTKTVDPPKLARAGGKGKKGQAARERTLKAEGFDLGAEDANRADVAERHPTAPAPATSEEAAYNHAHGILTAPAIPTDQILSPDADPPEKVLTPRDAVQEDRRVEAARAIAATEGEVDRIESRQKSVVETRERQAAERGVEVDKKAATALDAQHEEELATAQKSVKEARKSGEAEIADALEKTAPITTMQDTGASPGESPTIGELVEPEEKKLERRSTGATKRKTTKAPPKSKGKPAAKAPKTAAEVKAPAKAKPAARPTAKSIAAKKLVGKKG